MKISKSICLLADFIEKRYKEGESDYYMSPIVAFKNTDEPLGIVEDGDSVIFCCKRGEREIQLTEAFTIEDFDKFYIKRFKDLFFVILTLYHEKFKSLLVAFPPLNIENTLGEVVSSVGVKQVRIAESDKFAHVTFFFNGAKNVKFPGEEDIKIPSPKSISPEEKPELSAYEIEKELLRILSEKEYKLIVANFANGDVVGHMQDFDAKVKAAKVVDEIVQRVVKKSIEYNYVSIITADHGVLEVGYKGENIPNTSHTSNPVPFILIFPDSRNIALKEDGILGNIAPTILSIMGIEKPKEMLEPLFKERFISNEKVLLIILDGWGIGKEDESNPIYVANTWIQNVATKKYPSTYLRASGKDVGLLPNKPGNSEAGHINIGAGRIVYQDDLRIEEAVKNGEFLNNKAFIKAIERAKEKNKKLHLISLLSYKSSHGSIEYAINIAKIAKKMDFSDVYLHIILDGRSTDPHSAPSLLKKLGENLEQIGIGCISTIVGRGYALDRDGNYDKTKIAYDAMVFGKGRKVIIGE